MTEQFFWNIGLTVCWVLIAYGQYHQGHIVKRSKTSENVSIRLPLAVFLAQCVLLVKGIQYTDWSLIIGCLIVNSGVMYNLYQIEKVRPPGHRL